jgi:hypothetical protein
MPPAMNAALQSPSAAPEGEGDDAPADKNPRNGDAALDAS